MVVVGYGGLSQLRGLTGSRDECSLFLENTFNFQIMHHQCAVCIINVLYALSMCYMHYQCAICIINVLYALSMCSIYAISMCRLVCTINVLYALSMCYLHYQCAICIINVQHVMHYQCAVTMHYQCASGQFWTTGAPFYIFFFYYITVFLFIFSLFLFTFFSIIECRAVVLQPPQYIIYTVSQETDHTFSR